MLKLEQEKQTKDSKKTKKTKESSKSFYEQILDLQKEQLAAFKESEQRQQNLILTIIELLTERNRRKRTSKRPRVLFTIRTIIFKIIYIMNMNTEHLYLHHLRG